MSARRLAVPAFVLLSLLVLTPSALAQAAEEDENTIGACEDDAGGVPAYELVCPITVALHLRSVFGADAELVLWAYGGGALGLAIVVWILILLWRVLPRRYLRMKAVDTIREVQAGNPATYILTVENRRKRRPVDVELAVSRPPDGWSASLSVEKPLPSGFKELVGEDEAMRVPLSARKMGENRITVKVTVKSPEAASSEEWAELDVSAIPYIKDEPRVRRGKDARVVTLIKTRHGHPAIERVSHEPSAFRVGDEVTTTVVVANRGDDEVEDLAVALHVNESEIAREVVTIPAGGEALIEFPWVPESAESRVRVRVG